MLTTIDRETLHVHHSWLAAVRLGSDKGPTYFMRVAKSLAKTPSKSSTINNSKTESSQYLVVRILPYISSLTTYYYRINIISQNETKTFKLNMLTV